MSEAGSVQALEEALIARAQALADEYLTHGQEERDRILTESKVRLRRLEKQEKELAKFLGQRLYRQRVQAGELALRGDLDLLRWTWVDSIMEKMRQRLAALVNDEARYLPILAQLLKQAAELIERDELVARVNASDREKLRERWETWVESLKTEKKIILSAESIDCLGGVMVQSEDDRIRVNNTFEGRMERLREELFRVILERSSVTLNPDETEKASSEKSGASVPPV